jgi:hypothetical protein
MNFVFDNFVSSCEVLLPCCQRGPVLSAPYLCGGWLSRLGLVALVFARLSARPCTPLLLAFLGTDHIDIQFEILGFLKEPVLRIRNRIRIGIRQTRMFWDSWIRIH